MRNGLVAGPPLNKYVIAWYDVFHKFPKEISSSELRPYIETASSVLFGYLYPGKVSAPVVSQHPL